MAEHDNYGVEFLKATTRIKAICRGSYHTLCLCISLSLSHLLCYLLLSLVTSLFHFLLLGIFCLNGNVPLLSLYLSTYLSIYLSLLLLLFSTLSVFMFLFPQLFLFVFITYLTSLLL
jgi:hypothetical protein